MHLVSFHNGSTSASFCRSRRGVYHTQLHPLYAEAPYDGFHFIKLQSSSRPVLHIPLACRSECPRDSVASELLSLRNFELMCVVLFLEESAFLMLVVFRCMLYPQLYVNRSRLQRALVWAHAAFGKLHVDVAPDHQFVFIDLHLWWVITTLHHN